MALLIPALALVLGACGGASSDNFGRVKPDEFNDLTPFIVATVAEGTAAVTTDFEVESLNLTENISAAGFADLRSGNGSFELSIDGNEAGQLVIRDGSLFVGSPDGWVDAPVAGHNKFGGAVAGSPLAALDLLKELRTANWHKIDKRTYKAFPDSGAMIAALNLSATLPMTNRTLNRLGDQSQWSGYGSEVTVTLDKRDRVSDVVISMTSSPYSTGKVTLSSRTSYGAFGKTITVPSVAPSTPELTFGPA